MNLIFFKKNIRSIFKLCYKYFLNKQYPFVVALRLNDFCNLTCTYCDSYQYKENIDFNRLKVFLDKVYKNGCRLYILTGGEPFFYKNRDLLMDWFRNKNAYLVINTNGQLIENEKYKNFIASADDVLVSVDGAESVNDLHRGAGTYNNIIKTLDFLKKEKIKITLSAVLTKKNFSIEQLKHLMFLKKKYKATIGICPMTSDGRINNKTNYNELRLGSDELSQLDQFISGHARVFSEFTKNLLNYIQQPKPFHCKTMKYALYVDVDNNIYPCINVTGRTDAVVSNIDKYNFDVAENVFCTKCSCLPLITANQYFNKQMSIVDITKNIFQRYFRF